MTYRLECKDIEGKTIYEHVFEAACAIDAMEYAVHNIVIPYETMAIVLAPVEDL
jgi:hypothetical protein